MKIVLAIISIFLLKLAISCETFFDAYKSQTYINGSGSQLIETLQARKFNCLKACSLKPQCSSVVVGTSNSANTCSLFSGISNSTNTTNNLNLYKKRGNLIFLKILFNQLFEKKIFNSKI